MQHEDVCTLSTISKALQRPRVADGAIASFKRRRFAKFCAVESSRYSPSRTSFEGDPPAGFTQNDQAGADPKRCSLAPKEPRTLRPAFGG